MTPFTPPEQRDLERRQRIAEMLRMQAARPTDTGTQMAGGWAIPNSPVAPFERLGQALIASRSQSRVDADEDKYMRERQKQIADALKGFGKVGNVEALLDTPELMGMGASAIGAERAARLESDLASQREAAQRAANAVTTLTPEEVRAAGLPEGTLAQRDATGKVAVVNDPTKNLTFEQRRALKEAGALNINNYGQPMAGVDAEGNPVFVQVSKGGDVRKLDGVAPPSAAKPPTREERMDAGYAQRMIESEGIIGALEGAGRPTYAVEMAGDLPFVGSKVQTEIMTPEQQKYRQAQEDWVRAKLRKESGAAIGRDEMEREISTYFPPPGVTDPGVVEQYRRARETAIKGMEVAAGAGMRPMSDNFKISPDQTKNPNVKDWSSL
jgi:hypothetical protein